MHGAGVYIQSSGKRYEGEFKDDLMHGTGIYSQADGKRYEGQFLNDKRHGLGTLTNPNTGETYTGQF